MIFLNINEPVFEGMLSLEWRVAYTCIATAIINLPFGYFRGGLRKLSFWWFVAIHAPVPLVIIVRKFHDLNLTWGLAPFLLGSYHKLYLKRLHLPYFSSIFLGFYH